MIRLIYILTILLLFSACKKNEKYPVERLVFASIGSMCTYDSLGQAQLSLRTYVEYNGSEEIKIAKGDSKFIRDLNAPKYSLDRFYNRVDSDTLKQMINRILSKNVFKDSYMRPGDDLFFVMIYKLKNEVKQIVYKPDCLPAGLDSIHLYLRHIVDGELIPVNNFIIDSLFIAFQKSFFVKYPPPPPPAQEVKIETMYKFIKE